MRKLTKSVSRALSSISTSRDPTLKRQQNCETASHNSYRSYDDLDGDGFDIEFVGGEAGGGGCGAQADLDG